MPPLVSKSVLLIGGNQTVRRVLTDLASSHQLHLEMAPDGPACLARIEGTAYDLVLTDAETTGGRCRAADPHAPDTTLRLWAFQPGMMRLTAKSDKPEWIAFKVRCRKVTAERVVQFFRELKMDLPTDEREDIATAFRQMLMNAMEHGASFDPNQQVEIPCVRTSRAIVYRIEDPDEGFSFECLPHAAISNPPDSPIDHVMYRV